MINWGNLVDKGRAKAHGIPWNEEENAALSLGIPAVYVREGVLTLDAYKKAQNADAKTEEATGEKPVDKMNKVELVAKAQALGLEITPDVTNASLKEIIKLKLSETSSNEDADETKNNE